MEVEFDLKSHLDHLLPKDLCRLLYFHTVAEGIRQWVEDRVKTRG